MTTTFTARSNTTIRWAFTLVELLVVMTIIAILSSMILFALAAATESAKAAKTQATINKLNSLIMAKYDSYRTRRVPIAIPAGATAVQAAKLRLNAIRELMALEMPDDFHQIEGSSSSPALVTPTFLQTRPAVNNTYFSILKNARAKVGSSWTTMKHEVTAECLYMIVTRGLDDPDVLEQFSPAEIGDADGDGLPEFLDGWGNPIKFLRWAPAFASPLQDPNATNLHDPFDTMNVEPAAGKPTFPLYPLIYSAGPDGKYLAGGPGTEDIGYDIVEGPKGGIDIKSINYDPFDIAIRSYLGDQTKDVDGNGTIENFDNITNHDIEAR